MATSFKMSIPMFISDDTGGKGQKISEGGTSNTSDEENEGRIRGGGGRGPGCCWKRGKYKIAPIMTNTLKEGEIFNFRGRNALTSDWKKTYLVLSKTESDVPALYLFKDRPGGRLKHEILLPAIAHEIRFGKSCQYYGKYGLRNISDLKKRLPQMVAIPERYYDRPDPYIIWLWFPTEKDYSDWRKVLGDILSQGFLFLRTY